MTDLTKLSWRTGRSLGRTVYARTGGGDDYLADTFIGTFDTRELAEEACAVHNADLACRARVATASAGDSLIRIWFRSIVREVLLEQKISTAGLYEYETEQG